MRLLLTILGELLIDAVTGKLERSYREDKLRTDLRGDSRQWGAFVKANRPDVTPRVAPSGRR